MLDCGNGRRLNASLERYIALMIRFMLILLIVIRAIRLPCCLSVS